MRSAGSSLSIGGALPRGGVLNPGRGFRGMVEGGTRDETEKEPGKTLDFTVIGSRKCEYGAVMCVGTCTGEERKWSVYVCTPAEWGCTCDLHGFSSHVRLNKLTGCSKIGGFGQKKDFSKANREKKIFLLVFL